jgi:methyltransferase (TIGR00027 family)
MQPGLESRTAVWVCLARAVADGRTQEARFSDPTALALLPEEARHRVEEIRAGVEPRGWRERIGRKLLEGRVGMMVARTVAIDDFVRAHTDGAAQLVILGAGLDGRAWRMPELRETTVFEVDHPDSQRAKRARAASLRPAARDVRFVPVDFTRDRLDDALAAAGHDPNRPTTWIWEGVVMYLTPDDVAATLRVIEQRSAPKSALVLLYMTRAPIMVLVRYLLRRMGEPVRSTYTPSQMAALLARFGFTIARDEDLPSMGRRMTPDVAAATRFLHHSRLVTAVRS